MVRPALPMDPETPHQPHDKLLRKILAQRKNARSFFENHLPPELPPLLQWHTLRRLPASFIDNRLKGSESDLLFSVSLRDSPVLLYLLFEHQSTEDPRIALRLLGYIVRIWEHFAANKPASVKLPPVFPLVLAQGERPWKTSTQLADLVDVPPGMEPLWGPWQPTLRYHVMDLHTLPYAALTGSPETALALRLLKAARSGDLLADWIWDESLLDAISADARELWMRYVFANGVDRKTFLKRIDSLHSPSMKTKTLTLAEQFKREGLKEGLREGRREGRQEGREEGRAEGAQVLRQSLLRALELKHREIPEGLVEALEHVEDLMRLKALLDRAILSTTLEEFASGL